MILENFVVKRTEKFVRIKLDFSISIEELFNIVYNGDFDYFFVVFEDAEGDSRFRLPNFDNVDLFYSWVVDNKFKLETSSISSEIYDITCASYIDLYYNKSLFFHGVLPWPII